jgi:hypothetical protein
MFKDAHIPQTPQNIQEHKVFTAQEGIERLSEQMQGTKTTLETVLRDSGPEYYKQKKLVIVGPPNSGKSCLSGNLRFTLDAIDDAPANIYFVPVNPDGEGSYYHAAAQNNLEIANNLRTQNKSKFTEEFVADASRRVRIMPNPLVFVDLGGVPDTNNARIAESCNGAIVICSQEGIENGEVVKWGSFLDELGIPVIAEVYSDISGIEDTISTKSSDGVLRASIHNLKRGEKVSTNSGLVALAEHILYFEKHVSEAVEKTQEIEQPQTVFELEQILTKYDIDHSQWGSKSSKTLDRLVEEIVKKECKLCINQEGILTRKIRVLGLTIEYTDTENNKKYSLYEQRQVFGDGRERTRILEVSLAEKMSVDENPGLESVQRALREELGILTVPDLSDFTHKKLTQNSQSYPNLHTEVDMNTCVVALPSGEYKSDGYVEELSNGQKTYFAWQEV